ncbi:MAG: sn-glycerol-1-phosphate dehydrogenase [Candidatus Bathyarchaeia archaeon]
MQLDFMEIPRYVVMGPSAIHETPRICRRLGVGAQACVVSGMSYTSKVAEELSSCLEEAGLKVCRAFVDSGAIAVKDVKLVSQEAKKEACSFIVGVGGGRVIDVAKLASSWLGFPFISVPTSAAHDGISSPFVNFLLRRFVKLELGEAYVKAYSPNAIIADTAIIGNAPEGTLAAGCGDLLAKITSVKDWQLAAQVTGESYSEYAASMALMGPRLVEEHANVISAGTSEATRIVVKALIGSGVSMSIAGSSRPASGTEHLFSHALDLLSLKEGFRAARHGEQCGVGAILAAKLFGEDWGRIRRVLVQVHAPTSASQLGIDPRNIVKALVLAAEIRPERYTILSEKRLSEADAEKLATETGVI